MNARSQAQEELARTTIRMNRQLMKEAKKAAIDSGRTLTQFIEDSVRESLAARKRKPFKMRTFGGSGVQPGVDINNYAALLDIMEGKDDPSGR